jgi:ABC-type uncharacterized transport system permease subunit
MFGLFGFLNPFVYWTLLGRTGYGYRRRLSGESPCETVEVFKTR